MIEFTITGEELWARMERAVEKVNERLRKVVAILESAQVPYAVVGGHAVRAWVAQVDEAAVRNTRDVNILVRPADLPALIQTMTAAGWHHRLAADVHMFVDAPNGSARDAVHVVLTGEMVRPNDPEPNPDIEPVTRADNFQTLPLEKLVRMKLNSFRRKDQVHIQDMISIGLIDQSWPEKFPEPLNQRLQSLLDDPLG